MPASGSVLFRPHPPRPRRAVRARDRDRNGSDRGGPRVVLLLAGRADRGDRPARHEHADRRGRTEPHRGAAKLPREAPARITLLDNVQPVAREPKRSTLEVLRRTILEVVPGAEQVISYRVPAFRVGGKTVASFATFRDRLSYLPFSGSVLSQLADELAGYTMTKSALHFPVDRPLWKRLVETDCVRPAEAGRSSG